MRKWFVIVFLGLFSVQGVSAQMAVIHERSRHLMVQSSMNGQSLAWTSEYFNVVLNKWTGEMAVDIPIDGLYVKELNPDFEMTGENKGKVLMIRSTVPVNDVLEQGAEVMNLSSDAEVFFNGIPFGTTMNYSIFKMFPNGFSIQAEVRFPHTVFGIESLRNATDEIVVVFNFQGI